MKRRESKGRPREPHDLRLELERLRDQLRESHERYRLVADHVPARIVSLDADGRVRFVNHQPPGVDPTALVGQPYAELIPSRYRQELETTLERVLAGEGTVESVTTGTTGIAYRTVAVPVLRDETIDGVLIIATDITAQRRVENELRESEERHRSLLEGLPAHVSVIDRDRRIIYLNRTGPGFEMDHVIGQNAYAIIPTEFHERARLAIDTAFRTGEITTYSIAIPETNRSYSCRCAPVVLDGETSTLIIIATDVTDRVLAEKRLRLADRMTSMGSLVAGLAHELQNPLTYVIGNLGYALEKLELLQQSADPPRWEAHRELLGEALEGAQRASGIVRDLSMFARGDDEVEDKEVDLRSVLQSCLRMASNEIRHRAKLVVDIDEAPSVAGSASRLGQVFLNLLMNAAQAIPVGDADAHRIEIVARARAPGAVMVEVRDTGRGIPEEVKDRLFDPFFTTKAVGEGTGLGLSICNQIVASLGGTIEVEDAPGRGSIFRVLLPRFGGTPERTPPRPAATEPASGDRAPRRRILIIDDEKGVRRALAMFLAEHDVVCVGSGREALELLDTDSAFHRIFCDLMMPNMSGIEVFHELARRPEHLHERMVFITGGAFSPRAQSFLDSVDNRCLAKPFDLDEIRAAALG